MHRARIEFKLTASLATKWLSTILLLLLLSACNLPGSTQGDEAADEIPIEWLQGSPQPEFTPVLPEPSSRLLTICMANEPSSLFVYADGSVAARSIRQALYDGPVDFIEFGVSPVILSETPTLSNGGVVFEIVDISPGDQIVDSNGSLVNLSEGVTYLPSGCGNTACAQIYSGKEPVQIDQFVVRFQLREGLLWSDGQPLTADDSLYSYEIAKSLFPQVRAELLARTQSYEATDAITVEWRGVPGYRRSDYATYFFSPLPRHISGQLTIDQLFNAESTNRTPTGWGPFKIDEWTTGDHISLSRNPNYFRSTEGLPRFDQLVFRFISDQDQALDALLAGECDYLDETYSLEGISARMLELQDTGRIALEIETGSSWEQLSFGVNSLNPERTPILQNRDVRQAIAMCVDRERLVQDLMMGLSAVPDVYVHPENPFANPGVRKYTYDPSAASSVLENSGWLDADNDPNTPRQATGVVGIQDGMDLKISFLTTDEPIKQQVAQILKESLAECGIELEINGLPWDALLAPGPDGPLFGRNYSLAQFGWVSSVYPPCSLYTTKEIPGPYPDFPKGWGGANASGYSNPEYDRACLNALASLPELPEYRDAHFQAQQIYAEDLPSLPLYMQLKMIAARRDMCGVIVDPSADSALWNLEKFDYGDGCG